MLAAKNAYPRKAAAVLPLPQKPLTELFWDPTLTKPLAELFGAPTLRNPNHILWDPIKGR